MVQDAAPAIRNTKAKTTPPCLFWNVSRSPTTSSPITNFHSRANKTSSNEHCDIQLPHQRRRSDATLSDPHALGRAQGDRGDPSDPQKNPRTTPEQTQNNPRTNPRTRPRNARNPDPGSGYGLAQVRTLSSTRVYCEGQQNIGQ
jgi:hypothetical protein